MKTTDKNKLKSIEDVEENLQELQTRISGCLDLQVMAKKFDEKEDCLELDFKLVDLNKFREIQNVLINQGLLDSANINFINFAEVFSGLKEKLDHDIDKVSLLIDTIKHLAFKEGSKECRKKMEPLYLSMP